jgi:hypothetical protein
VGLAGVTSLPDIQAMETQYPQHKPLTSPTRPAGLQAGWLAGFHLDDAPASAPERARALTLGGIACAIVG